MKNGDIKLDLNSITAGLGSGIKKVNAYKGIIFFVAVAGLYGFILWRINTYSNIPANQNVENSKAVAQPHVDAATVQKIQQLQDNSVSVKALFNQARQNPFQE
jgi:hypothetical protein